MVCVSASSLFWLVDTHTPFIFNSFSAYCTVVYFAKVRVFDLFAKAVHRLKGQVLERRGRGMACNVGHLPALCYLLPFFLLGGG